MRTRIWGWILLAVMMFAGTALATEDGYWTSYTYNYDYWDDLMQSPDAYKVETVLYSTTLGLSEKMLRPQSLFVLGEDIYVCDTGNNRILQIRREDGEYSLVRIIDRIRGTQPETFNSPNDIAVDPDGNIYVCDTNNNRVVMVDRDLNFLREFVKPVDTTFDQNLSFLPNKLVVDVSGRVYVLATNVNKGLIKFENDTTFTGYIGANQVTYSLYEYIWKSYILTEEQRDQQTAFVPTEYSNCYMDADGFIYATNTVFDEYDLLYGDAKPIRRLNGIGNDILIRKDKYAPVGDIFWVEGSERNGPSRLVDVTVLENDIYVAIDRTRGRIFGYDSQGVMLWAFGTKGNEEGAFLYPSSIEHIGRELICLDQNEGSITVFVPTEYGNLVYDAIDQYSRGAYDQSAQTWEEVLRLNANYNMAFRGIGRALLRREDYQEAMEYFEMAHDRENYGRAFKLYRKEWIENNILWIVEILVAVIVIGLIISAVKKRKKELYDYERRVIK